jgi:TonB family protein
MTARARCGLVLLIAFGAWTPCRAQDGFVMVVHAANPVSQMTPMEVSHAFLKRIPTWDDGSAIEPVDLPEGDATRAEFSRVIHGRSVDAIAVFWRQQAFAGKGVAPPVRQTPGDVLGFVASNPRAIGYVPAGTTLPAQVKVLVVRDEAQQAVYDIGAVDPPARLTSPPLRYPALLRRDGIEGQVLLEFVVLPDGRVAINDIAVVETTDDRFNDAAMSVVRGTRFRPGRLKGEAVAVRVRQRVEFNIAR